MMSAATENEIRDHDRKTPISVFRFLSWSVLAATLAALAAYGLQSMRGIPSQASHLIFSCISGFAVSSAGWLIVLRGFRDNPERITAYFGAGLLAKLVLLVVAVGLVNGLELLPQDEFLIPFAIVFFVTGFAQLGITVKGATKLLAQAPKSGQSRPPAAPGVAVDPGERG